MAYNFPSSPTEGQVFMPPGGPTYVYTSPSWKLAVGSGMATAYVGDNAPSSPNTGQLWWESDTGNLFVWYDDGNTKQWVQVNVINNSLQNQTAQTGNRIVNGAMLISQENGNTSGTAGGYYAADQWNLMYNGITGIFFNRGSVVTPDGSQNVIGTATSIIKGSLAAGDFWNIRQYIEGTRLADFQWGTASAKRAVLRFNFNNLGAAGTYAISILNGPGDRSWVSNFSAPAGWSKQVISVPGDTSGVWPKDTSRGAMLTISPAVGSTYLTSATTWIAGVFFGGLGMSNGAAATTAFYLADVGLYLDDLNAGVPPRWEMPNEAEELITCMRYWEKGSEPIDYRTSVAGTLTGITTAYGFLNFKVMKRAAPAMSASGFQYYTTADTMPVFTPSFVSVPDSSYFSGGSLTNWKAWGANGIWIANARV